MQIVVQIVCTILKVLLMFQLVADFRYRLPKDLTVLENNPVPYFYIAQRTVTSIQKIVTVKRFWIDNTKYAKILTDILQHHHLRVRRQWVRG